MDKINKIIDTIINEIFEVSGIIIDNINNLDLINKNFTSIGLCSLDIVQVIISLEEIYNIEIDYELNNIHNLADYILKNGDNNEGIE